MSSISTTCTAVQVSLLSCASTALPECLREHARDEKVLISALKEQGLEIQWTEWGSDSELEKSQITPIVLIRSTWDYSDSLEKKNQFISWLKALDSSRTKLLNNVGIIEWNSDKKYLIELEQAGIPIVPTLLIEKGQLIPNIRTIANEWNTDTVIIKPAVGASARGLTKHTINFSDSSSTENIENDIISVSNDDGAALLQPFLPSILKGEISIICINNKPLGGILKVPKSGDFRVQEEWGGKNIVLELNNDMILSANKVLNAIPNNNDLLYARLDFVEVPPVDEGGTVNYLLMEAECIEPDLFFNLLPNAAKEIANIIKKSLESNDRI
jgi:glutathione synthase/RimK-type ligase-like ATP-grasp enzyme